MTTLERFLAETGPNAAHRSEVQETVQVLRGRVGRLAITADRNECDLTLDDQPAGTTPLAAPLLVSIGRRRVAMSCPGMPRLAREVEVAAGETVALDLKAGPLPASPAAPVPALTGQAEAPPSAAGKRPTAAAWIVTGVLAGATTGFYAAAYLESRKLDDLRHTYPITNTAFDDKLNLTSHLALVGDILAVATVVSAGVATYFSVSSHEERGVQVGVGPTGVSLRGTF